MRLENDRERSEDLEQRGNSDVDVRREDGDVSEDFKGAHRGSLNSRTPLNCRGAWIRAKY